jgi:hypothetical protein
MARSGKTWLAGEIPEARGVFQQGTELITATSHNGPLLI